MITVKSNNEFNTTVSNLVSEWGLYRMIAAKIIVPPEMIWWYWQEFGTALYAERSPSYPGYDVPSVPDISITLRFEGEDGRTILTKHVFTTGVPAKHMVTSIHDAIRQYAFTRIREVIKATQYNPAGLEQLLLEDIMPRVKDMIRDSFAENLHEHAGRQFGRLPIPPEEEFESKATIVNTTV
jgi:hypothetical protein